MKRFIFSLSFAVLGIGSVNAQTPDKPVEKLEPLNVSFAPGGIITTKLNTPTSQAPIVRPDHLLPPTIAGVKITTTSTKPPTRSMAPGITMVFFQRYEDDKGRRMDSYETVTVPFAMQESVINAFEARRYELSSITYNKP